MSHPLADLFEQYSDAEGIPLMTGSQDWDQINAALTEWVQRVPIPDPILATITPWLEMLRVVIQMVYIFGYRRGKREATMPMFVVAPEEDVEP